MAMRSAVTAAGMTLTEVVIVAVAVAAVIVFVAVLVLVPEMSRRRGRREARARHARLTAMATRTAAYVSGEREQRPGPFGPIDEGAYGGAPRGTGARLVTALRRCGMTRLTIRAPAGSPDPSGPSGAKRGRPVPVRVAQAKNSSKPR